MGSWAQANTVSHISSHHAMSSKGRGFSFTSGAAHPLVPLPPPLRAPCQMGTVGEAVLVTSS